MSLKKQCWPTKNCFTPELNEKEVIELLENATPGNIKKATNYGMKIFQGGGRENMCLVSGSLRRILKFLKARLTVMAEGCAFESSESAAYY